MALVSSSLLVAPLAAEAQQAGKVYLIGMLDSTPAAANAANVNAFRQGMRELGYVEGQNLPAPPGSPERFAELRGLLSILPTKGTNTVIVGHGYPFYSLVGGQYLDEGEAAIVQPDGAGFKVVARLGLKQWQELAKSAP
jgi:hypothetical protein